jgi:hypothetical protein
VILLLLSAPSLPASGNVLTFAAARCAHAAIQTSALTLKIEVECPDTSMITSVAALHCLLPTHLAHVHEELQLTCMITGADFACFGAAFSKSCTPTPVILACVLHC